MLSRISPEARQYLVITGNYWAFTLTDGALRMLVLLHFHQLGYSPLQVASLFLFYELFGVITNLLGGWLGARIGLNRTMHIGLLLQVLALGMLTLPGAMLGVTFGVTWVMAAQALSGIAKDLNKMSAKSSIKLLLPASRQGAMYRWVAALTGSKNALKGAGFFLGGVLLTFMDFSTAVGAMALGLLLVWLLSLLMLRRDLGKAKHKPKFRDLLSKSRAINLLSAARLCLFGARDVWFVIALPVFLYDTLGWSFAWVGGFLAAWTIGYGGVQALAPWVTGRRRGQLPGARTLFGWAATLSAVPLLMAIALFAALDAQTVVIAGLALFGLLFAINSSMHSYLIVSYAREDGVSLDVGFYYMANAIGRLLGTLLSGLVFQYAGLAACLVVSAVLLGAAALIALGLPPHTGLPVAAMPGGAEGGDQD